MTVGDQSSNGRMTGAGRDCLEWKRHRAAIMAHNHQSARFGIKGVLRRWISADERHHLAVTEVDPLREENQRLRGLLALTLLAIEEHLNTPDAVTEHVLSLQMACIREALSQTTGHSEPPLS
jgi:hypothetical protein